MAENRSPIKKPVIALITDGVIGKHMAGPGIRYWEFARVLGQHLPVKLIIPPFVASQAPPPDEDISASFHNCDTLSEFKQVISSCQIIITLNLTTLHYPFLFEGREKFRVFDVYNPVILEVLQRQKGHVSLERVATYENLMAAIMAQFQRGDFFICASEKQRDHYLGLLLAAGRLNPFTHEQDETFRQLIDVVPFGLPRGEPQHTRRVLKGTYKSIGRDDQVILWGGGIWDQFDAPTLVRALPIVLQQRPNVKIFFMGINRPDDYLLRPAAVDQTIDVSRQLGLYNQSVFFNDWVPYQDRQNYLLEADVGASLHIEHTETRFSFRTRLLDAIWTGLPMVCTRGDVLGEMMAANGLAELVEPGDVEGVAQALVRVLAQPGLRTKLRPKFQHLAESYRWQTVTQPVLNYCLNPYHAADRAYIQDRVNSDPELRSSFHYKVQRALRYGGVTGLISETRQYIRWKIKTFRKL